VIVDMEDLLPIGEFAAASRLSPKALRLYAAKGLLAPAWVDPDSGYRYYRPEQLGQASLIALLRRAGMPLGEIRSFLRAPTPERLDEFERRETADFAERRRVLRYVRRIVEEEPMFDVATKQVAEQRYVSRSRHVLVPELESFIRSSLEELRAGGASAAPPFVLYHGPVNEEEDGPVEVCVPRPDGDRSLTAGEVAFTAIEGEQCAFPQILGAYEAVYRWAKEQGREPAGPAREIYVSAPQEELRMEIAVPLRA
jgi:DNA-binding transcriptional MerR regulator